MNTRTTLVVAIVAAVVAAYVFLVARPWEEPEVAEEPTTTAKPLFDPKPEDIDRIEVTVSDSKDPQRVFKKQDDAWMMTAPIECPAQDYQVKNLIVDKVSDVKYLKEYPAGDKDRPRDSVTGLSKPAAIVKLFKGDQSAAELVLGARLPTGKGNYVQRGGSDTIYESQEDLSNAFTKRLSDYRNKSIVKANLKDVTEVEVTGLSNFKLARSDDDTWMIERPTRGRADKSRADRVARAVTGLYVRDWVDDEPASYKPYRLDEPRLKVTVKTVKEIPPKAKPDDPDTKPADTQPSTETKTHVLMVGGQADNNTYFARIGAAPWVFSVSDTSVKDASPDLSELREKSLAKVDLPKVTKVAARTPDGTMTLTRREKSKWTFADAAPCDATAVQDLIKAVRDLKATDFVDPGQVVLPIDWDRPRAKITLTQEGEPNPTTVLVGPPSASGKMVYLRNAAEEAIAVVREDEVDQLLAGPVSYRDRQVMKFPRARAKRIEIARAGAEPVALTKGKNKWSLAAPVEAPAEAEAVRKLLQDLASLRAKRVAGVGDRAKFGLDSPAVRLAVHLQPLTAEPGAKVVGKPKTETQPAEKGSSSQPSGNPATQPAGTTRPAGKRGKKRTVAELERLIRLRNDLLQYQKDHPDEEKPELTKIIRDEVAELKEELATLRASTQPAGGSGSAATRPAAPPTIYRLLLSQQDGKTYACRPDGDMVYELESQVYQDATAEMHDRQIAKFEVGDVIEVTFDTSGEAITLRKSGDEWRYAADPVLPIDKQKVTDALNDLRDLKTHRYVAYAAPNLAQYKLDRQVNRVAVGLDDGTRIEISASKTGPADDPDQSRYAMRAGANKVFLLKGEQADKFAKKLEDFEKTD